MLSIVLLIVTLCVVLTMVPGIPPTGKMILNIVVVVLCILLLVDVIGGLPLRGNWIRCGR